MTVAKVFYLIYWLNCNKLINNLSLIFPYIIFFLFSNRRYVKSKLNSVNISIILKKIFNCYSFFKISFFYNRAYCQIMMATTIVDCLNNDFVKQFMCATDLTKINFEVTIKNIVIGITRFDVIVTFFSRICRTMSSI